MPDYGPPARPSRPLNRTVADGMAALRSVARLLRSGIGRLAAGRSGARWGARSDRKGPPVERLTSRPTSRPTVLVVEDDRSTSDLLREVVEAAGLRFVPANEGHLAMSIAVDERPQVITLDLGLPDTDGHAVLHRLLADERTRHI